MEHPRLFGEAKEKYMRLVRDVTEEYPRLSGEIEEWGKASKF